MKKKEIAASIGLSAIGGLVGGLSIVCLWTIYSLLQGYRSSISYSGILPVFISTGLLGAALGCASYCIIWFIGYWRKERIELAGSSLIAISVSSFSVILLRAIYGSLDSINLFFSLGVGSLIGMPAAILTEWFYRKQSRKETAADYFEVKK